MHLVRRKRGEAAALPDGVVARMQISPYRVQLAGIEKAPVSYEPLLRTYQAAGVVREDAGGLVVPLEIAPRHASWLRNCRNVTVRCNDTDGSESCAGQLRFHGPPAGQGGQSRSASVVISDRECGLESGMMVDVTCLVPVSELEPFRSLPTDPPPLMPGESRQLFSCPEHPDLVETSPGRCAVEGNDLAARPIAENQRLRWWCPMHPAVTADHSGQRCQECGGMRLRPRVISYQPKGKVLTIPESAVVDTGMQTIVFIETMPGMFDGVRVVLGPRCGQSYAVVSGLEAGQQIAVAGAFLLDAETRLNPGLASSYFGAAAKGQTTASSRSVTVAGAGEGASEDRSPLANLDPLDRPNAARQKICPVTRKALGSMGTPVRVALHNRIVFLCCSGCKAALEADPARYLAILEPRPVP
jgi:hypothetical protein